MSTQITHSPHSQPAARQTPGVQHAASLVIALLGTIAGIFSDIMALAR